MGLRSIPNLSTLDPNMGAVLRHDVGAALFGRTRRELLALFFSHPERSFYLREIIRRLQLGQGAVQRDLARLSAAGLLLRDRVGSQVHYQANPASPVFSELRGLMIKSVAVGDVLRRSLEPLGSRIRLAFVFGPIAGGEFGAASDVDLMVIGEITFRALVSALQPAQQVINREINPSIYSVGEFSERMRAGPGFLKAVVNGPKFFLIGDEHELGILAEGKLGGRSEGGDAVAPG